MLPHLAGRPVTMERFPAGIEKKGFIQKDVSKGFPAWLQRVEIPKRSESEGDGAVHYPLVEDARALLWLANQNAITPHVWTSRVPKLHHPDLCVFDLDPAEDPSQSPSRDQPAELRAAALAVRELLTELGLASFVKTSGSKGFHIVVALDGEADFEPVRRFSQGAGAVLVKRHPALFTQEFIKADRGGRIFVDTGRNGYGATFAAAYALRPKPGAPVSAPCAWSEIRARRGRPPDLHAAHHLRPPRGGGRPLAGAPRQAAHLARRRRRPRSPAHRRRLEGVSRRDHPQARLAQTHAQAGLIRVAPARLGRTQPMVEPALVRRARSSNLTRHRQLERARCGPRFLVMRNHDPELRFALPATRRGSGPRPALSPGRVRLAGVRAARARHRAAGPDGLRARAAGRRGLPLLGRSSPRGSAGGRRRQLSNARAARQARALGARRLPHPPRRAGRARRQAAPALS